MTWATAPVAANRTVQTRIGNLAGTHGYSAGTPVFGAVFGPSSGTNITIDPTNGFRVRYGTTDKITLDASGNASFVEGNVTIDETGISVAVADTTTWSNLNAYRFTGGATNQGTFGYDTGTESGIEVLSQWSSAAANRGQNFRAGTWHTRSDSGVQRIAEVSTTASGSAATARISVNGGSATGLTSSYLALSGDAQCGTGATNGACIQLEDATNVGGEIFLSGISGDGTGKVACVKSDGAVGTCTNQPNGSGVCTCS